MTDVHPDDQAPNRVTVQSMSDVEVEIGHHYEIDVLAFHATPQVTLGAGNQPTLLPIAVLTGTINVQVVRIEEGQILCVLDGDAGHITVSPDAITRAVERG